VILIRAFLSDLDRWVWPVWAATICGSGGAGDRGLIAESPANARLSV